MYQQNLNVLDCLLLFPCLGNLLPPRSPPDAFILSSWLPVILFRLFVRLFPWWLTLNFLIPSFFLLRPYLSFSPSKKKGWLSASCLLSWMSFPVLPLPFLIWALHPTFTFPTELLNVFLLITMPWPNQLQLSPTVRPAGFLRPAEARVRRLSGKPVLQTGEKEDAWS